MRQFRFLIVFIMVAVFCTVACAFTVSYEQTTSGAGIAKPDTRSVKIKDDKIRMEMDHPVQGRSIVIIKEDTMVSYMPAQNRAFKMKNQMGRSMEVLSDYAAYLESLDAKIVGSENVGSYNCDIYEFVDPRVNMKSKVWLWKTKQFPVKVEMETPQGAITTIMKNIKVGIAIDDSEFMLPPGVEIVETPGMMQQ